MTASTVPAPNLSVPESDHCCRLSIIDTTTNIAVGTKYLVAPVIESWRLLNLPTFAFHITHDASDRQLLFDIGCRKDWENLVPHVRERVASNVSGLKVDKDVLDILTEGNVDPNKIEGLVLSHFHFDHCGDPSALPKSMKVLVGPGFTRAFLPGWPARADSPFHEADFDAARELIEVPFSTSAIKIGKFDAHDYFGDGSFYILNVPGHTVGHIGALVRTTPDTFVFLGGDSCHFTGVIRPTRYIPLPDEVPTETALDRRIPFPCPCSAFTDAHRDPGNSRTTPFYTVSRHEHSFYQDPTTAEQSVQGLLEFDANPNILMAIAHDPTALDVFDFFPNATMNEWKEKGWKQKSHWGFLSELPYNGKLVRQPLVDGLYMNGNKVRGLHEDE